MARKGCLVRHWPLLRLVFVAAAVTSTFGPALADGSGDPTPVKDDDGKWYDNNGNPTFHITKDGKVDWYTFSGFRRYNSSCIVCHGPDGGGSTYAPALTDSLKALSYSDFVNTVVNGKQDVSTASEKVMPALGTNPNVMCYLDDIFVYLRARSDGALRGGRPQEHAEKPKAAEQAENGCMGPAK
jgi:methanol metabolism-related c-type cytochrome